MAFPGKRGIAAVCALAPLAGAAAPEPQPPNIVLLYADDFGYGDLGVLNPASKIPTPRLDQLAREGTCFTDAHSSSAICTPSRYALLTGRYHWRKFHDIVESFEPPVLDDAEWTLPELLRARGYATACIGKWHLGWEWQAVLRPGVELKRRGEGAHAPSDFDWSRPVPGGPLSHGFDYYFGDDVPNFPPYAWIENDRVLSPPTLPYAPDPVPEEATHEGRPGPMVEGWKLDAVMPALTEKAVAWIAAREGNPQPFFLYFPWTSPHTPIVPAKDFQGATRAGPYGDFVHQSDTHAGAVLDALDRHGFRANTLVIFTSDNGPEHFAYDRATRLGHRSMGPLRGVKRDLWEGGHRVPFVVRWPAVVAAGRVSGALTGQIDLMATLAAAAGATLPAGHAEDSLDQLPVWRGDRESVRDSLVHNTWADGYALRQGDWLLIDKPTGDVSAVPEEFTRQMGYTENPHPAALFNLREDPGQRDNRYAAEPERVAAMRAALERIRRGRD